MSINDDDRPIKRPAHDIGCDLSMLSVDELANRIELLKTEIGRLEEEKQRKGASRAAAEGLFR
ncbi:DUF1192 domain-containing protein [Sinorhizobium sp. BG8]|uniref:DUF1192 domain-containing protein n=1 Tax=Sinorhizobium sp. BG8 TaxID=2613773 RepID=UPI00193D9BAE|nr:DUF1192 domain-containing protein [Sinorhizobium sp. BG8]QRM56618.1 DUF1192 domain-containing protein [Sinorhizobium sp. BG8]